MAAQNEINQHHWGGEMAESDASKSSMVMGVTAETGNGCHVSGVPNSILEAEQIEINERRKIAGIGPIEENPGLVGLALSGGGLRSAVYHLGLLQGLKKAGLLRYVDYLSTVSGGGYIGSYWLSLAQQLSSGCDRPKASIHDVPVSELSECPESADTVKSGTKTGEPHGSDENSKRNDSKTAEEFYQNAGWLSRYDGQFRDAGQYLGDFFQFAGSYLFSTFCVLVFVWALLIALAAGAAFTYRSLDLEPVDDVLSVIRWDVEALKPFLPTLLIAYLWVVTLTAAKTLHGTRHHPLIGLATTVVLSALSLAAWRFARVYWLPALGFVIFTVAAPCMLALFLRILGSWGRRMADLLAIAAGLLVAAVIIGYSISVSRMAPQGSEDWCHAWLEDGQPAFLAIAGAAAVGVVVFCGWLFARDAAHGNLQTDKVGRSVLTFLTTLLPCTVLAGLVVLMTNSMLNLSWIGPYLGLPDGDIFSQKSLREPLFALILLSLLPLLSFRRLLESTRREAGFVERLLFKLVIYASLIGLPLTAFGFLVQENVSGFADYRNPELLRRDILQWRAFADLSTDELGINLLHSLLNTPGQGPSNPSEKPDPAKTNPAKTNQGKTDQGKTNQSIRQLATAVIDAEREFENEQDKLFGRLYWERQESELADAQRGWLARLSKLLQFDKTIQDYLQRQGDRREAQEALIQRWNSHLESQVLTKELMLIASRRARSAKSGPNGNAETGTQADTTDNPTDPERSDSPFGGADYQQLRDDEQFLEKIARSMKMRAEAQNYSDQSDQLLAYWFRAAAWALKRDQPYSGIALAASEFRPEERREFNRLLLEALFPNMIRPRKQISTKIVPMADQCTRGDIFWGAVALAVPLAFLLPVNLLAPFFSHYRRQIRGRFLSPPDPCRSEVPGGTGGHGRPRSQGQQDGSVVGEVPLSQMDVCKVGAPYPLLGTTLQCLGSLPADGCPPGDAFPPNWQQAFVLSPKYCGSSATGYFPTTEHPFCNIAFADAVTISGAALSPMGSVNSAVLAVMAALNLRINRWYSIPDPKNSSWRSWWLRRCFYVTPFVLLREIIRGLTHPRPNELFRPDQEKPYRCRIGALADGGFTDFLGVMELLKRRCRLVIVSDAGRNDKDDENKALGDVIRRARQHDGIRILELDHDRPLEIERLRRDSKTHQSPQHFVFGRIQYLDGSSGLFVYLQMAITGDEELDLVQYNATHGSFPHEPIVNQFFTDDQVEAYRSLGFHTASVLCQELHTPEGRDLVGGPVRHLTTDQLIEQLTDGYCLHCGAEERIRGDFLSRLSLRDPALFTKAGDTDLQKQHSDREEFSLHLLEQDAKYRRASWQRLEKALARLSGNSLLPQGNNRPPKK